MDDYKIWRKPFTDDTYYQLEVGCRATYITKAGIYESTVEKITGWGTCVMRDGSRIDTKDIYPSLQALLEHLVAQEYRGDISKAWSKYNK